jgi:cellulose synthase/poly-beta-1,6-N-acetylglucosamine synthase-like glycosyltransferase
MNCMYLLLELFIGFALLCFAALIAIDVSGAVRRHPVEAIAERKDAKEYNPNALVIVPCKGKDIELEKNLKSLKSQDYNNYDVIAVVADNADSAVAYIKKAGLRYITADASCKHCSAKVKSIATALEKFRGYDVYAIADSDVLFDRLWLSALVAPLANENVGISTMYPKFLAVSGFWSKVKEVWGLVGEGMMSSNVTRFGWGGSLAFRKNLLDKKDLMFFKDSKYSISDDICLTKICKRKKLRIAYSKNPKIIVKCNENAESFIEWANRQTALTAMGYPKTIKVGIAFYSAEIIVLLSGIILSVLISPVFLILLIHPVIGLAKTFKRAESKNVLTLVIALFMPFLYLLNLIIASRMKSIIWRGIEYKIKD